MKTLDEIVGSATFTIICILAILWVGGSFLWWAMVSDGWLLRLFSDCYECEPMRT